MHKQLFQLFYMAVKPSLTTRKEEHIDAFYRLFLSETQVRYISPLIKLNIFTCINELLLL